MDLPTELKFKSDVVIFVDQQLNFCNSVMWLQLKIADVTGQLHLQFSIAAEIYQKLTGFTGFLCEFYKSWGRERIAKTDS